MVIDSEYRKELVNWIGNIQFINPFAITLTMKSSNFRDFDQNYRHFSNRLNQSYLQSRYRRYQEQITNIPIREGVDGIRTHLHCILDNPFIDRDREFVKCIKDSWNKTFLSLPKIQIEKMRSDNWIGYITKFRSKSEYKDSVDWSNVHINKH